jgi:hypothetical protein
MFSFLHISTRIVQKLKTVCPLHLLTDLAWDFPPPPLHSPCSPDLFASDRHLFTHLKQFWGGTRMRSDEEMKKTGLVDWLQISTW